MNANNEQADFDKIYSYAENPHETKYQVLIDKRESTASKHLNDSKDSIQSFNDSGDIYKNTKEYNPNKKHNILIVFDNIFPDMLNNKKLN